MVSKRGMIKPHLCKGGYLVFQVNHDAKHKVVFVHRLIAEAYIPNPYHLPQVNHKDENKINNEVSNLEWCSPKYNSEYSRRLHPERERQRWHNAGVASGRKRARAVCAYRDGVKIATYESVESASRAIGCHRTTIDRVLKKAYGYKTAKGFKWLFAEAKGGAK